MKLKTRFPSRERLHSRRDRTPEMRVHTPHHVHLEVQTVAPQRLGDIEQEGLVLARLNNADAQQHWPASASWDQRVALPAIAPVEVRTESQRLDVRAGRHALP